MHPFMPEPFKYCITCDRASDVILFSIDPGEHCRFATWDCAFRSFQLVACGTWVTQEAVGDDTRLVIEDQVIYPPRRGFKGTKNPKSIIHLAHQAGHVTSIFGGPQSPRVKWVLPKSWKDGTAKPKKAADWASYVIHRLVLAALAEHERALYVTALMLYPDGQKHDLTDAVGLGLWELGRLK